jgi:acetyl esterase/lipase
MDGAGQLTERPGDDDGTAMTSKPSGVTQLVESYGDDPLRVGEWFAPAGTGPAPTVLLIHGGFWRQQYDRHIEDPVALDLAGRGYLCWNIDYRSAAEPWPATLSDVAAGYDHLYHGELSDRVDPTRVALVGHSAGGHLVAWLAGRHRLSPGAPGYNPQARPPSLVIPQAGAVALTLAADQNLGSGATQALIGGSPKDEPERYHVADPLTWLPTGVRTVLLHDRDDDIVPIGQSETYVAQATAVGDTSRLEVVPGTHLSHIEPDSAACERLRDTLGTMTG